MLPISNDVAPNDVGVSATSFTCNELLDWDRFPRRAKASSNE